MFSSSLNVLQTSLKLWALASFYYYKIVAFDHFSHSPLYNNRAQYLRRSAKDFSLWQVQLDRSTISYIERAKKQYNGISIHHNSDTDNSRQNIYTIIDEHGKNSIEEKIKLPKLTSSELDSLAKGNRIQKQSRSGLSGSGLVVVDVNADVDTVFNELKNFNRYVEMIPTVRSVRLYGQSNSTTTMAEFSLSKFCLRVNVVHNIDSAQRIIKFGLDSNRPNLVMRKADGFWYMERPTDRPDVTRVWLSASIVASRLVPTFVVDYAAARALPRATTWLQPYFSQMNSSPI